MIPSSDPLIQPSGIHPQRTACLSVTGASRSCPTAALQVLLDLPPLPLFIETEAMKWAMQIKASQNLKPGDLTGHLSILNRCKVPEVGPTDAMRITYNFIKKFSVVLVMRGSTANTPHT